MKFVKLLKYVEKSFEDSPSFLILMSDNREYISNRSTFIENTPENRDYLMSSCYWGEEVNILLNSKDASLEDVVNGRCMFYGCKNLVEFKGDLPNLKSGGSMFYGCENLVSFKSNMPNLEFGGWMFYGCENLMVFEWNKPNMKYRYRMFNGCDKLKTVF